MNSSSKSVLITGGHGFIGGHVARRLHQQFGYRVRIADIANKPYADSSDMEVMVGNLCEYSFCVRAVEGIDYVLHFAATMGGMGTIHENNDFIIYEENHRMTVNMLSAAVAAGTVQRFFYASSACVYPDSLQGEGNGDVSLRESDVWAELPPNPQGLYGLEKLNSELVLNKYRARLDIRIARFHNIFGPWGSWKGGREKAPAALLRKALAGKLSGSFPFDLEIWGDGDQRRSFCFIDDAVDGIIQLLHEGRNGDILNIGSDRSVTISELAAIAVECAQLEPGEVLYKFNQSRPVGVSARNANNELIREKLGWVPKVTLEEGMRITSAWIKAEMDNITSELDPIARANTLRQLQNSIIVDLNTEATTFAVLLPITSKGLDSPQSCLNHLRHFAQSLASTTRDDIHRLGERYNVKIYLAIDHDDNFLWLPDGMNKAEEILHQAGFTDIVTVKCQFPAGEVCSLWRKTVRQAYEDGCHYFVLMGDDIVLKDTNWMSRIHATFKELAQSEGAPTGFGCIAFTDTSFPGMPTFPVVHRTHMDIFEGVVVPEIFVNQDGDPYLFQLYRRWGCSRLIDCRISNKLGGSGEARYKKQHTKGWTIEPLSQATSSVETYLRSHAHKVERKLTLDVIVPCYRVDLQYIGPILSLNHSPTCDVMFIVIVDDPNSTNYSELLRRYEHRIDVRIRKNEVNLGASASRNRGLDESAAEWVHFLDDDITPADDLLIQSEAVIRRHPDAAGFVCNAQFPSADSVYTAAIHLAGVTYFWDIATKMPEDTDMPWGVTANLIARRDVPDGVVYDLTFPKTGGGEDIDYCRKKREYSVEHGGKGFCAAPNVTVTHPWWNQGNRSYWRFYMWSKGDGALIKMYPQHAYQDVAPNSAELLLLGAIVTSVGGIAYPFTGVAIFLFGIRMIFSVILSNLVHDIYRHLWRDSRRTRAMKTSVNGIRWVIATMESSLIRMFSEIGRTIGVLERGEVQLLGQRFEWFTGRAGNGPREEEMMNTRQRTAVCILLLAIMFLII